jgi:RNA polymerase sigma factor (sigma-70 family)
MVVDDDPKETNVSPAAANSLLAADPIDSAINAMPHKAIEENAENEDLGVLFRSHYKGIFRVAYRITGSHSDAEDVLQTIFVRLAPDWSRRDLSPNPRAYLYRAAMNASLDLLRGRTRANAVSLDVVDLDRTPRLSVAKFHIREILLGARDRVRAPLLRRLRQRADRRGIRYVAVGRRRDAAPREGTPAQGDRQLFGETS